MRRLILFFGILFLCGCATVREVSTRPGKGGVIAIKSMTDKEGRKKAEELMKKNCKGNYTILKESEAIIAKNGVIEDVIGRAPAAAKVDNTVLTAKDKEWRMTYSCDPE